MKILKVYTKHKDGRIRARIRRDDGSESVVSYPRILMEMKLGKPLDPSIDVHHIDGDKSNNDLDNLALIPHGYHQSLHRKYHDKIMTCDCCGRLFVWKSKTQSNYYRDLHRSKQRFITCSKKCAYKLGISRAGK